MHRVLDIISVHKVCFTGCRTTYIMVDHLIPHLLVNFHIHLLTQNVVTLMQNIHVWIVSSSVHVTNGIISYPLTYFSLICMTKCAAGCRFAVQNITYKEMSLQISSVHLISFLSNISISRLIDFLSIFRSPSKMCLDSSKGITPKLHHKDWPWPGDWLFSDLWIEQPFTW